MERNRVLSEREQQVSKSGGKENRELCPHRITQDLVLQSDT